MRPKTSIRANRIKPQKNGRRAPAETPVDEHLYLQVARTLKKEIVGGVFPVGSRLPTEEHLCERFSVSRFTVREALGRLREDNLVSSRKGARTTVIPRRSADSYAQDVMSINDLLVFATGAQFVIESIKMILVDEKVASVTGLASGEEWLLVRGFRRMEDADLPFCWTEYYINREFAAVGRLLERHTGPVFPLIEDMFGQSIVEVHLEISAVLISRMLADSLKVDAGTAALEVRCSFNTSDDVVAQVSISTHPASRYRHSMTMRRVKS